MIYYLTANPFYFDGERLFINEANELLESLREDLTEPISCLYVSSDPNEHEKTLHYARDLRDALKNSGFAVKNVTVLDNRNAWKAESLLSRTNFVLLAGGHVPTQNAFLNEVGLRQMLEEWDGVLMGISAGSMNSADAVYAHPEEPGEAIDPDYERWLPGLGITGANILPHFQKWKDDTLDGLSLLYEIAAPDSDDNYFFLMPDGSYIYGREGKEYICGESELLHNGEITHLCDDGEIKEL